MANGRLVVDGKLITLDDAAEELSKLRHFRDEVRRIVTKHPSAECQHAEQLIADALARLDSGEEGKNG